MGKQITTYDKFIDGYCSRSGVSWAWLSGPEGMRVALPCACGDDECEGWAMVRNDPHDIEIHVTIYGPENETPTV